MASVATLVIHYIVEELTNRAVKDLLAQDYRHNIFVVDCGSPKAYENPDVEVWRLDNSRGLAGSINWAMKRIEDYDYAFQYTNDVTSPPEVLGSLVRRLTNDVRLAAIQPSMASWHRHLNPMQSDSCAYVPYLEWAAVLVNLAAWKDVGPLDEEFNFFSMDIDWSYRAKQKGWKLAVDYSVRCGHLWRGTHSLTEFDIGGQSRKEYLYGAKKYGRKDWNQFLMGGKP